jgi:sugar/nucleoside kinase (ribokinase family)
MPLPLVDFTGIGENATDIVLRLRDFPTHDGKTDTVSREVRLGGQVATAVVAAASWGLRCRYVGAAGSDHNAELHQKDFRARHIDSHLVRIPHAESRLSYILVEQETGSRAVLCHRDPLLQLSRHYLRKEWFQRSRLLHVDGENAEASRLAAAWAREAGVPVMCDLDQFRESLRFLLPQVDYPVLSQGVLGPLGGSNDPLLALPTIRVKYGSTLVCTTMGEQGALAWDGHRFWYAPAYRVSVADTTGAGDLFHAGFAYGVLHAWDLQHTLEFACAAAGLNCKAHGARGGIAPVRNIERLRSSRKQHPRQYSIAALRKAAAYARRTGV